MRRNVIISFLILLVSLGFAYKASLKNNEGSGSDMVWARIEKADIERLVYKSPDTETVVSPDGEGKGFWIDDKSSSEGGSQMRFKGNEKLDQLLSGLNPFMIKREVGPVKDLKAAEFGLEGVDNGSLQVMSHGKTVLDLKLGRRGFGSQEMYVLDQVKGVVLSIPTSLVDDLKGPRIRLFERELFRLKEGDFDGVEVNKAGTVLMSMRSKKSDKGEVQWADSQSGEVKEAYGNWFAKVRTLRVEEFAAPEFAQPLEALEPALLITLQSGSKAVETISLKHINGPLPAGGQDYAGTWWAKTGFLGAYVKVNTQKIEGLVKEAGSDVSPKPSSP